MSDDWKTLRVPTDAWERAKAQKEAAGRTWGEQIVRPDGDGFDNCPRCGTPLDGTESFCPSCAAALTDSAAAEAEAVEDDIFASMAADDHSNADLLAALRQRFNNDPEMRELLTRADDSS